MSCIASAGLPTSTKWTDPHQSQGCGQSCSCLHLLPGRLWLPADQSPVQVCLLVSVAARRPRNDPSLSAGEQQCWQYTACDICACTALQARRSGLWHAHTCTKAMSTTPGDMQFTFSPRSAHSVPSVWVIFTTADFEALYATYFSGCNTTTVFKLAVLMILPYPWASMCLPSSCNIRQPSA